jgi:hypothetical protein
VVVSGGHTLVIHTTHASDNITITDDGQGDVSATVTGAESASGSGNHIQNIIVIDSGGNDTISYQATSQLTTNHNIQVMLHNGHDSVNFDFSKGVSANQLRVDVDSHQGHDTIGATFGAIQDTSLNFVTHSFRGSDAASVNLNGNVSGVANANFQLDGFRGNDSLSFGGGGNIDVGANLTVNLNGHRGDDQLNVGYEGQVDGNLKVVSQGARGNDTITTNVAVSAGSNGVVVAHVSGDHGNDSLTLNVTDNSGNGGASTLTKLDARIRGAHGSDTITHTSNVQVVTS